MSIQELWNLHKLAARLGARGARAGGMSGRVSREIAATAQMLGGLRPSSEAIEDRECEGLEPGVVSRQPCSAGLQYPHH